MAIGWGETIEGVVAMGKLEMMQIFTTQCHAASHPRGDVRCIPSSVAEDASVGASQGCIYQCALEGVLPPLLPTTI